MGISVCEACSPIPSRAILGQQKHRRMQRNIWRSVVGIMYQARCRSDPIRFQLAYAMNERIDGSASWDRKNEHILGMATG